MSTETTQGRRQIRAAIQIHTHLSSTGRFGPIPILYDHEWNELANSVRRFELAREKGWQTAADSLLSQLDLSAASLGRRLDRFRYELPRAPAPMQVSGPRDIAADLAAMEEEFVVCTSRQLWDYGQALLLSEVLGSFVCSGARSFPVRWRCRKGHRRRWTSDGFFPC